MNQGYSFSKFIIVMLMIMPMAHAQWRPGTVIFELPTLPQKEIKTIIDTINYQETKNGDTKSYSINIPVKQEDGTYAPVKVSYSESSNTRTLTIPGRG